jgi:hypothetical protein
MSGPRGLKLNGTQVIASVLATLTGAVAASYLGVGGTLVGAALGSIASTMGSEVYRHYLLRSQERLRSAGEILYHRTVPGHTQTQAAAGGKHAAHRHQGGQDQASHDPGSQGSRETVTWRRGSPGSAPDAETQAIPTQATWRQNGQVNGRAGDGDRDGSPGDDAGPGDTARMRASGQVDDPQPGDPAASGPNGGHWWDGITRRQWLTYGGITLGAFLAVIAVITIFELSVGKPVDAVVWGKHTTGTSVGDVVSGHGSQPAVTHPPSTPSAHPRSSAPQSPAGSVTPSSPAPTPSASASSPSASSSPSPTPSAPASPGGGSSIPPAAPSP